jgi:hypothetical protein
MDPRTPLRPSLRVGATVAVVSALAAVVACGAPTTGAGSNKLMAGTFAGQNKCNPKNQNRPFIIEWDATDMSSFEAHASNDIVFVRYVGCDLEVLEGCRDDSVKGAFGSYAPVQWTSGSVETIDVATEDDLYAKLPLGAASLGGRVQNGDTLHMEYYVSGTRNATRSAVYRSELAKNPSCTDATHFVYGYNLGAFALGSTSKLKTEINGSYFGFGAGGGSNTTSSADKRGGVLSACTADSAKESDACKVPIRLSLREISSGDSPDAKAAGAPETDAAKNLAGRLEAQGDAQRAAAEHLTTAMTKLRARDGAGCVAELDAHDQLDSRPTGLSTNAASGDPATMRAKCVMLGGQCAAGKDLLRRAEQATSNSGGGDVDADVEFVGATYCQGSGLTPREQYVGAWVEVTGSGANEPGYKKPGTAACGRDVATLLRLRGTVTPKPGDRLVFGKDQTVVALLYPGPNCFLQAGDCAGAVKAYGDIRRAQGYQGDDAGLQNELFGDAAKYTHREFAACAGKH